MKAGSFTAQLNRSAHCAALGSPIGPELLERGPGFPKGGVSVGRDSRLGQGWLPAERVFGPGPVPRYDAGKDGFIDLMELKRMMEKLGAPQTHLGLKTMIKEVDEDVDSKLSFREVRVLPPHPTP